MMVRFLIFLSFSILISAIKQTKSGRMLKKFCKCADFRYKNENSRLLNAQKLNKHDLQFIGSLFLVVRENLIFIF